MSCMRFVEVCIVMHGCDKPEKIDCNMDTAIQLEESSESLFGKFHFCALIGGKRKRGSLTKKESGRLRELIEGLPKECPKPEGGSFDGTAFSLKVQFAEEIRIFFWANHDWDWPGQSGLDKWKRVDAVVGYALLLMEHWMDEESVDPIIDEISF